MPRLSPLMLAPPLIFAALAVMFYVGMFREDPNALPFNGTGEPVRALSVVPLGDGPVLTSADLTAEGVKLLNFWASWCAPCRAEHSQLEALAAQGVPIHGINFKDDPVKALAFLAELGDPFTKLAADPKGETAFDWGVYGVPETYVIDGAGRVILRFPGPITPERLRDTILPAIEKAGAAPATN